MSCIWRSWRRSWRSTGGWIGKRAGLSRVVWIGARRPRTGNADPCFDWLCAVCCNPWCFVWWCVWVLGKAWAGAVPSRVATAIIVEQPCVSLPTWGQAAVRDRGVKLGDDWLNGSTERPPGRAWQLRDKARFQTQDAPCSRTQPHATSDVMARGGELDVGGRRARWGSADETQGLPLLS